MLKQFLISLLCICLLAACAPRNAAPSENEPSSSEESSSTSSAINTKQLTPEEVSSSAPVIVEAEEEFPAPTLSDNEKTLLKSGLDLFVHFIGTVEVDSPSELSAKTILSTCVAELERTKDLNAYFFPTDDNGKDLIPAGMIAEKANQLFGVEKFELTSDESYVADKESYIGTVTQIAEASASDVIGAPNDQISYKVTLDGSDFIYIGKIYRQNGMPYLRFASVKKAP